MKYFVQTTQDGKRIPLTEVEAKRQSIKEKILDSGQQYIETEALMGQSNAMAQRVESRVYVIESISNNSYV